MLVLSSVDCWHQTMCIKYAVRGPGYDKSGDDSIMPLKIREFDLEKKDWRDYIEQVGQYFIAHGLNSADKEPTGRALFLSGVGSLTYVTLKSLLAPAKPDDKKFEEIVEILQSASLGGRSELPILQESPPTRRDGVCFRGSVAVLSQRLQFR